MVDEKTDIKETKEPEVTPVTKEPEAEKVESKPVPETKDVKIKTETKEKGLAERPRVYSWLTNFDRTFNDFRHGLMDWFWGPMDDVFVPVLADFGEPAFDITETETEYKIQVEIPGMEKEDVKIELEDRVLTVSGEKKHEEEKKGKRFLHKETSYESFCRSVELPDDALVGDDLDAKLDKGILEIIVKRKAPEPKKEVKIK